MTPEARFYSSLVSAGFILYEPGEMRRVYLKINKNRVRRLFQAALRELLE